MTPILKVTNNNGRTFNVRIVQKGDRYGRGDALVHNEDHAMVEFYDATYENDPRFADFMGRGQFVSSYYLFTLMRDEHSGYGLDLYGGEPLWQVSAANVADAIAHALSITEATA